MTMSRALRRPLQARSLLLAAVLAVAPLSAAMAQQVLDFTQPGGEAMQIQAAEALEWRQEEHQFVAIGDAVVTRGDVTISAQRMVADYREDAAGKIEIYRFSAEGGVVIERGEERITGGLAVYDVDSGVFTMTGGNLGLTNGETTITATRSLEYRERELLAVALGGVHVSREDEDLWAERVAGRFAESGGEAPEIVFIEASGGVRIETPTDIVTGDSGTYDLRTSIATLSGSVKLTRGDNQLNGEYAEVNMETGVSRLTGSPQGGRVSGLLVPADESDNLAGGGE